MNSQLYSMHQHMPLLARSLISSDQSIHQCDEGKVDNNMPNDAAKNNNVIEGDTTSHSSAVKTQHQQPTAMMTAVASSATMATEESSITPSIETTFMAAAASYMYNSADQFDKHLGDSLATLPSLPDLEFTQLLNDADDDDVVFFQAQPTAVPTAEDDLLESTSNNTDTIGNSTKHDFLRPRTSELHHFALAMDIVGDLEDDTDDESDQDSVVFDHSSSDGSSEQRFDTTLSEGLKVLSRPRKSEKHIFFIADYLLHSHVV